MRQIAEYLSYAKNIVMYTLPVYEIKAIGNVKGAMFAPNSDTESILKDGNPLVANAHKSVRVSKIARARMR